MQLISAIESCRQFIHSLAHRFVDLARWAENPAGIIQSLMAAEENQHIAGRQLKTLS
jgi:hypothetical protein